MHEKTNPKGVRPEEKGAFRQRVIARSVALVLAVAASPLQAAPFDMAYAGFSLQLGAISAAKMAGAILASESSDDSDGFPLPPAMLTGSGGPTGGGLIPVASNAPKLDGTSGKLGYCAWDNGSITAAAGRIAGTNSLSVPAFAVIAPGSNGAFNTTCADVAAGIAAAGYGAKGDDIVVAYSTAQLRSLYSLHVGPPVANTAALNALAASSLRDGEIRLVKSDNSIKRWDAVSSTWKAAGGGGFSPDVAGNLKAGADAFVTTAIGSGPAATDGPIQNLMLGTDAGRYLYGLAWASDYAEYNVGLGYQALRGDAAASASYPKYNVAIGYQSMGSVNGVASTGVSNVAIGYMAMASGVASMDASYNVAIGEGALSTVEYGSRNVALGLEPLRSTTTGNDNVALGAYALLFQNGEKRIAIGYLAGLNTSGSHSIAVGVEALKNATGGYNIALGNLAGDGVTSGTYNTLLGASANVSTANISYGTALGAGAVVNTSSTVVLGRASDTAVVGATGAAAVAAQTQLTGGLYLAPRAQPVANLAAGLLNFNSVDNTLYYYNGSAWIAAGGGGGGTWNPDINGNLKAGTGALANVTTGSKNIAIGEGALAGQDFSSYQIGIGSNAGGRMNGSGTEHNVAIGRDALLGGAATVASNMGYGNVAIGYLTMKGTTGTALTGSYNVALGARALTSVTSGGSNFAAGERALQKTTTGSRNVAIGSAALLSNLAGDDNVAIGNSTLYFATGSGNIALGASSLIKTTTGANNIAIGGTMINNLTGSNNVALSPTSMFSNTSGSFGVAIGTGALFNNTTGSEHIAIGRNAQYKMVATAADYENIAIGRDALYGFAAASPASNTGGQNIALGFKSMYGNGGAITGMRNNAMGGYSLYSLGAGSDNIALGYSAMAYSTTGKNNIAIGYQTLLNLDAALPASSPNIAIGYGAMSGGDAVNRTLNIANANIAIGYNAMKGNSLVGALTIAESIAIGRKSMSEGAGGLYNIAFGTNSMQYINGGSDNIAMGFQSMWQATSGGRNIGLGQYAIKENVTGHDNVAVGHLAGSNITTNPVDEPNTLLGSLALSNGDVMAPVNNTAYGNVAIGYKAAMGVAGVALTGVRNFAGGNMALSNLSSGSNNVALGYQSLLSTTTGSGNVSLGSGALSGNATGFDNLAIGRSAAGRIAGTDGAPNIAIGSQALYGVASSVAANTGYNNIALGSQAMYGDQWGGAALTGHDNFAAGAGALKFLAAASNNVAIGVNTLPRADIGDDNIAIGQNVLANARGSENIAIGKEAMRGVGGMMNAARNIAIGSQAMYGWNGATGGENVAIGSNTMVNLSTGTENVAIGNRAASAITTGGNNVAIGALAGYTSNAANANTTGANNTFIGANSGPGTAVQLNYATAIGSDARVTTPNTVVLGRTTDITVIGDTAADTLTSGYGKLQVAGHVTPTGDNLYNLGSGDKRWAVVYAANGTIQTSDSRLKTNVTSVSGEEAIKILEKMNPIRYNWSNPKDGPSRKIGFLAQELAAVLPEVVHIPSKDSSYYGVNYAEITALLTAAVKRQQEALSFFSVKKAAGAGEATLVVNGMLEADVLKARRLEAEQVKVKELEAESIKTKSLMASKVLSGESTVFTGNGCVPVFAMDVGAVYDVRAMSSSGGWGSMRIGMSEAGPSVQDRKMSENGLGIELNVVGNQVCAISAVGQKVSAGWLRVL